MPPQLTEQTRRVGRSYRWLRFFIGLVLLGFVVAFFASGYSPPGAIGDVLRHNQQHAIDASPLFYTEVDNMHELESGLADLRNSPSARNGSECPPE